MNWLDIGILVFLVISAIGGFATGLIKTVFSLAGLIVGIALAGRMYEWLSGYLGFIPGDSGPRIAAFIIIFLAVMIIASVLGAILTKVISFIMLGWINRLAGAVLGVFLGATFIAAILAVILNFANPGDVITDSKLASLFLDKLPFVLGLLPSDFDSVRQFFQ
jgi:membrane protein required for colicin V production